GGNRDQVPKEPREPPRKHDPVPARPGTDGQSVMELTHDLERLDQVRDRHEPPADGPARRDRWPSATKHWHVVDGATQPGEVRDRRQQLSSERSEDDECGRSVEVVGLFRQEHSGARVLDEERARSILDHREERDEPNDSQQDAGDPGAPASAAIYSGEALQRLSWRCARSLPSPGLHRYRAITPSRPSIARAPPSS